MFPCYFGSALKLEGVEELLDGLEQYALTPSYSEEFAARVFKIARDGSERLTYLKVTGGSSGCARSSPAAKGRQAGRRRSTRSASTPGKYQTIEESGGAVCAVTG